MGLGDCIDQGKISSYAQIQLASNAMIFISGKHVRAIYPLKPHFYIEKGTSRQRSGKGGKKPN